MKQNRQRRKRRFFAAFLCFCMLFTMPGIQNVFPVTAAGYEESFQQENIITAFEPLLEDVEAQTVFTGTDRDELDLPEVLTVYLLRESSEQKVEEIEQENTDTENENEQETQSEESKVSEETDEIAVTNSENADNNTDDAENGTGESVPSEEQEGSQTEWESGTAQETHIVAMQEYHAGNVISVQTLDNTQTEEQEETVTIDGVTWQSEPEYDGSVEGTYTFTAILPEGYSLAEDVSLPQITVTVIEIESDTDFVIQALLERIAALPGAEEYLALEPDMEEDEDVYAEWEEKLYAYAKEALAIWEEYEALAEEQQAQILEEELAKLTAWVELAETLTESSQVMTADVASHTHCFCGGNINAGDHTGCTNNFVYDNILTSDASGKLLINGIVQSDYTLATGNYYLAGDVTLNSELIIKGNVYICLNGKKLENIATTGCVIYVGEGNDFTLCDCDDSEKGCITGGKGHTDTDGKFRGGAIYMYSKATFNMFGGVIIQNEAYNGGGAIYTHGSTDNFCTVNIYGGKIINNSAGIGQGGGILGTFSHIKIWGGSIEENTAGTQGGGILADGDITISDASIINNKVNSTAGGGIFSTSKGEFYISGTVNITGNMDKNGEANNICFRSGLYFNVTGNLKGSSIGVTAQSPPTSAKPTPVPVADGNDNHTVTDIDWSCFFSDNKNYKIVKDGNALFLALPDTCDLSGLDLTAEGAKLEPNFQADITTYTATVGNEVDTVGITATLAGSTNGRTIELKNGDDSQAITMTSGVKEEVDLVVGLNKIKITVTSGSDTKEYTLNITREAPAGNPVTITTYKDSLPWTENLPTYKLISDNGTNFVTDLTAVPDGTYHIYYAYGSDKDIDTGVEVKVEGAAATSIVNYYTVTFYDGDTELTTLTQQIVPAGATASAPTDNPTKTGYTFSKWVTADGGSIAYDFKKAVTGKTSVYASWTPISYSITYVLDGGNVSGNPTSYTIESSAITLNNPTKEGYTFAGWSGTGLTDDNNIVVKIAAGSTGNREYTAHWTAAGCTVTLNGDGGTGTALTGYTYGTGAALPTDWAKTGYDFAGWYDNENYNGNPVTEISATDTGNKTFWAKWTPKTYQVTFHYHGADGGDITTSQNVTYNSKYGILPVPTRTGYTFKGWYTEADGKGTEVNAGTTVTTASAHTLHAYWKDETAPDKPTLQDNATFITDWTNSQTTIPLKLYDGVGVTALLVSVDGSPYVEVSGFSGGTGSIDYSYTDVQAGEHTYQFMAKDAAGNTSVASDIFTVKLDQTKPVIGTLTYENEVHLNFWHWIIGRTSMIIHVPVTDTGSGVTEISFCLTPRDAVGNPDSSSAETKTATVTNGEAKITFDKDFRGSIAISCTDAAGNAADGVTVGKDAGGVIVEDQAPVITVQADRNISDAQQTQPGGVDVSEEYYNSAPALIVTVKDDTDNAITAGIATVTYQFESGEVKPVSVNTGLQAEVSFTIPSSEIPTGSTRITIKTTDNAGNPAEKIIMIKVKGPEKQPDAEIDYREEKLTRLVPGERYIINGTEYTADQEGRIPVDGSWFGTTVNIVKKGNGNETTDSPAQSLPIPARPAAPAAPELSVRDDKSITLKTIIGAQYRLVDGTGNWQDSTVFEGLNQKTIYTFKAYYPATDTSFASEESSPAQIATVPTAPTPDKLAVSYEKEIFTLHDGVEAFTDQNCTTPVEAGSVEAYMGQTIYIRYPADGIIPESPTTPVPIPARPAKPAPGKADASYPGARDGAITGLEAGTAYEYRVKNQDGSFGTWQDAALNGTRIENLPAGEYEVRVKAVETGNAGFRSEAAAVTIGEKPGVKVTFVVEGEAYAIRFTGNGGNLTDIPPVPAKENAIGAWCMDEQGTTPAVFTNITADMTVYAVYTTVYTVTLQTGTGYILSAQNGSTSPVKEGGSFTFRFALSNGYQKTADFAVKVNDVKVELTADNAYTISDIRENKTVTVEGVAKKPSGKPSNPGGGDKENEPEPTPTPPPSEPPDDTPSTPSVKPPAPGTTPPPAEKESEGRKPGTTPKQEKDGEQEPEGTDGQGTDSTDAQTQAADSTDAVQTTKEPQAEKKETHTGSGTVIVTVVCEEEKCTAAVADTEKVVKAVLTPDQQELVDGGGTIEIRIDVTDISGQVPEQDKEVIENGIEEYRKEVPGLALGMYVDISMFIRIGAGEWNAITETKEPIEIIIGIPEKVQSDGRVFYIIRAHEGEYAFMNDLDDVPDTITVSTDLFSSYAIAYVEADETGTDNGAKCGLCHICPTFLGVCYFVWLAIIILILIVVIVLLRKKKE